MIYQHIETKEQSIQIACRLLRYLHERMGTPCHSDFLVGELYPWLNTDNGARAIDALAKICHELSEEDLQKYTVLYGDDESEQLGEWWAANRRWYVKWKEEQSQIEQEEEIDRFKRLRLALSDASKLANTAEFAEDAEKLFDLLQGVIIMTKGWEQPAETKEKSDG